MKPYTIVCDWDSDWWEPEADDVRCTDEPQVFHVWAKNACDASDEADQLAGERFTEMQVLYLSSVAVMHGHAQLVRDGE
ncbi:hypothetical protein [Streptomyces sp. NPDC014733]|uniref:hypothetical protein n=1 Tax=Streptomyces sp. NPDC014733 TaxID=3364885 RepID=UPI0036FA652A